MILIDTSVWIDHLYRPEARLLEAVERREAAIHEFVVAEIALGSLRDPAETLRLLDDVPRLPVAAFANVRRLIEASRFYATGIGYVDAHLLVSVLQARDARLWTRDRRLMAVATRLGILAPLA